MTMEIGYKLYENLRETNEEEFNQLQLEMALACDANGWCMEDGYDENGDRYLIINPPQEITLAELKILKLDEIDAWTAAKITGGFISDASGETVRYDSDTDTQLTMQGIALNVNTALFAEKYPDGCPVRGVKIGDTDKTVQYLNAEQVLAWCADLSMHIGMCKQAGWLKQAEVATATTPEELDAIILA